jgi:hypothetical protein
MTIPSFLIALIALAQLVIVGGILYLVTFIQRKTELQQQLYQRVMDKIVGLEPTGDIVTKQPNEATQEQNDFTPLDENVPWDIPGDVKIKVEGGDTLVPPGYEVN